MGKSLGEYLQVLEKEAPQELVRVKREVSTEFEISRVIAKLERQNRYPAVIFEHVKDSELPVICNLLANRKKMAVALHTTEASLNAEFRKRESKPLPTRHVPSAPVQQIVWIGEDINFGHLPVPIHNEKDGGKYITPGVMVTKEPDLGVYDLGVFRHMVKSTNLLGVHLSPTAHARRIYEKLGERNEPMEVAIVLGHHPAFLLSALSFVGYDVDEYEVAAGIMGEPLDVVKGRTIDLDVPAEAEIVIEGKIQPGVRKKEGPFGEYTGVYGPERMNPEIEVTAISMRREAYFYDLHPGGAEHLLWGGTPRLSQIHKTVSLACPGVKDVFMPVSGCCRFICYISIDKVFDGEPKEAIFAAMAADPFIKYCVVVDSDVNIFDDGSVLHAISTRLHPEEDVFMVKNCRGNPLDPTGKEGYTRGGKVLDFIVTKVGIDATKPLGGYPESLSVPGVEKINLDEYISES